MSGFSNLCSNGNPSFTSAFNADCLRSGDCTGLFKSPPRTPIPAILTLPPPRFVRFLELDLAPAARSREKEKGRAGEEWTAECPAERAGQFRACTKIARIWAGVKFRRRTGGGRAALHSRPKGGRPAKVDSRPTLLYILGKEEREKCEGEVDRRVEEFVAKNRGRCALSLIRLFPGQRYPLGAGSRRIDLAGVGDRGEGEPLRAGYDLPIA